MGKWVRILTAGIRYMTHFRDLITAYSTCTRGSGAEVVKELLILRL